MPAGESQYYRANSSRLAKIFMWRFSENRQGGWFSAQQAKKG